MVTPSPNKDFIREYHLESVNKTLFLHQKFEGDVSCVVWDAALVLGKYLEELHKKQPKYFENLNVLELGAGVGCVGLTAACLGANVTLTDLPGALELLRLNISKNEANFTGKAVAVSLAWGRKIETVEVAKPDVILLADCVYYRESIDNLIETLREMCEDITEIFMGQELRDTDIQRSVWRQFLDSAEEFFNFVQIPLHEQNNQYSSPDILLLKLTKKYSKLR